VGSPRPARPFRPPQKKKKKKKGVKQNRLSPQMKEWTKK
jgi:hypothetical protein